MTTILLGLIFFDLSLVDRGIIAFVQRGAVMNLQVNRNLRGSKYNAVLRQKNRKAASLYADREYIPTYVCAASQRITMKYPD